MTNIANDEKRHKTANTNTMVLFLIDLVIELQNYKINCKVTTLQHFIYSNSWVYNFWSIQIAN